MSLKRYAILSAINQMHTHHQMDSQNLTRSKGLTTTTATTTSSSSSTTTTTLLPPSSSSDSSEEPESQEYSSSSSSNSNSQTSSTSTFTTYFSGGLGLYHQQHQRGSSGTSGGGISLLNGAPGGSTNSMGPHTYANVVHGNVNLLLGGAMLSLVTTILCVVCYCCHRNIKKRTEAAYRQQHQWLENDPNMEIYSVEQCYETSGLFLGDSTDGLSALPALRHEPPPSYDAVVLHEQQLLQQQQQQQQQQLQQLQLQQQQQRVSPPPGYHSTLDICHLTVAGSGGLNTPDIMPIGTCPGLGADLSGAASSSSDNFRVTGPGTGTHKHMKRVLNAQSCCSLQRAEVESMWNAAAAAVAARNNSCSGSGSGGCNGSGGNCMELETFTPTTIQTHKHGPTTSSGLTMVMGGGGTRLNTFGRRYLQQSQQHHSNYRRGCPLCGKFRYEAEDAMTVSSESVLEDALMPHATDATHDELEDNTQENVQNRGNRMDDNHNGDDDGGAFDDFSSQIADEEASSQQPNHHDDDIDRVDNSRYSDNNSNSNNNVLSDAANGNVTAPSTSVTVNADENKNDNDNDNGNGNAAAETTTVDLDSINDNGIISLDMSKIIDTSGLPTYEGALKLESSGYV